MSTLKFALLLFLICSCQSDSKYITRFTGNEMTIDYRIQIGQSLDKAEIDEVLAIIAVTFHDIDSIFNNWNPKSEVSFLNRLPAYEKASLSNELYALLKLADNLYILSDGKFDPTIAPLQKLWANTLAKNQIPSPEELAMIKPAIGWSKIHFDAKTFWKEHDLTSLNLCGIAKGHLVDLMIERLTKAGFQDIYVEWGGEIRVHGQHPEERPWTIFISQLGDLNPNHALAIVPLCNEAIATSGDYEQFWEYDGKRYFHVMNPYTFSPLEQTEKSIASASIIAPSCALADGLATTALLFEEEAMADAWLSNLNLPIKFWLKTRN